MFLNTFMLHVIVLVIIFVPSIRPRLLHARSRSIAIETAVVVSRRTDVGDWWLLYMLARNMDPLIYRLERGVRQGDTISPKLFNAALENIFKELDWTSKGIIIDGERLNNLRFADDIALISDSIEDMIDMRLPAASARAVARLHQTAVVVSRRTDVGDWWLLYMLARNMDPLIYRELISELAKRLGEKPLPRA
ncbi:uncharacterized protein LOC114365882 [Ostrinia furnacalis]|uniref:uncharacterized protein LOC114365882 n=1 Tax=Ostrinia furnacalis TaxID=93504 RepID=UPI0010406C0D|nr:uncharacterized protein LOC114365882 [Ostrinia furnacalis]